MAQGKFWTDTMRIATGSVVERNLFDLSAAEEANKRLESANPFG
jgi:hypothetical protein